MSLPDKFASIPPLPLLLGPSPIYLLPRITVDLSNNKVSIYAKREDLNSALANGGNKTRKLEISPSAASRATRLGKSPPQLRVGLRARLIQEHWVDWEDRGYESVGNIQLSRLMGADVRLDKSGFGIGHKPTAVGLVEECKGKGEKPYYIPAGASDHPLGGLDFARWAFEVREQEREMGVFLDTVIVCVVTGSTMAGMVAGFKLIEKLYPEEEAEKGAHGRMRRKVVVIDASAKPAETRAQVQRIARDTAEKIGLGADQEDIVIDELYHAGVYGIPDKQTWDAIEYGASLEDFITDPGL
ncbi:1-aminocyclopropane-1-carboxylate deaminase [Blastomyces percursus]|uniref:1-aminocyclopropane-1-carboxylate deaminase n=1 Tax=Blastomyces percursus TaxID=1658174 RepID=A0A1J9Q2H1_9EURO|nr:1-aminocyclopropane-1-carboxylate deaminase [Blastomyces percursus]